jgi:hypothetical protein
VSKTKSNSSKKFGKKDKFKSLKLFGAAFMTLGLLLGIELFKNFRPTDSGASVPDGLATVYLEPESGTFAVGEQIVLKESIDMVSDIAISGIATRLIIPITGAIATPEINVESVTIDPAFSASGDWTCPTRGFQVASNNTVVVDIACANTSASGYVVNGKTPFATITLRARVIPFINPVAVRFDPALSVVTVKSNNTDTLLIPTATSLLTIVNRTTPTPSPRISPTKIPTRGPTVSSSACSIVLYPAEVTVRKGEEVSFAAFVNNRIVNTVKFTSQNSSVLTVNPASDSSRPFLMRAVGHKVNSATDTTITATAYNKNQELCKGTAKVKVLP